MSFTVVTALINIDRENWQAYSRSWYEYMKFMENVMRMGVPMCIFVEEYMVDFITNSRSKHPNTKIYTISIKDYVLYSKLDRIKEIQQDQKYKSISTNDPCPEIYIPLYDVVVNNKIDFLYRVSKENPFSTENFVWIDAGYGHSRFLIPEFHKPDLTNYVEKASLNKIVVNTLEDKISSNDPIEFFKDHQDFIDGGLVVGNADTIEKFHKKYYSLIDNIMEQGIIDDDQYFMSMMYVNYQDMMFTVRIPNWDYRKTIILGNDAYSIYINECVLVSENIDKFNEFKRNNNINTMLEKPDSYLLKRYSESLKLKYESILKSLPWLDLLRNDYIGNPHIYETSDLEPYVSQTSHATIRYILYGIDICMSLIERKCQDELSIIEVGCSYGGFAVILEILLKHFGLSIKEYVLVDLPEVLALTKRYLSEFNSKTIRCYDMNESIKPNLFISMYSFGEMPVCYQNEYINLFLNDCKYGYIVWKHRLINPLLSSKQDFDVSPIEPQFDKHAIVLSWPKIHTPTIDFNIESHNSPFVSEYRSVMLKASKHLVNLLNIVMSEKEFLEDGIMNRHCSSNIRLNLRQVDLYVLSKLSSNILNIGFNAGFSTLIMLIANPNAKITCVDICEYKYTEKCFEYLNSAFPSRLSLLKGKSSTVIIPSNFQTKVDLININGSYERLITNIDFWLSRSVCTPKAYIIWNSLEYHVGLSLWLGYVNSGVVIPISILSSEHMIGQMNNL